MYLVNAFEQHLFEALENPDKTFLRIAYCKQFNIGRSSFYEKLKKVPLKREQQNFIYEFILNNVHNGIKIIEKAKRYSS